MRIKINTNKKSVTRGLRVGELLFFVAIFTFLFVGSSTARAAFNENINYQGKLTDGSAIPVSDAAYDVVFRLYTAAAGGSTVWTESLTNAALWTETASTTVTRNAAGCGGSGFTSIVYATGTNENSIAIGQTIWNTTLKESAVVTGITTGTNTLCVSNPYSSWTNSDDLTNRVYAKSGLFSVMLGTVASLSSVDFNQTLYLGVTVGTDSEMSPRKMIGAVPAAFTAKTLNNNGSASIATNAGSTLSIGNTTGAVTMNSGGTSAWTNTSGGLTISTATSGTLALTSAGALNLSSAAASTVTLANVTNSLNFDSNTLSIDALNNRVGIGINNPGATLSLAGSTTTQASLNIAIGTAPTAPNNGDLWYESGHLYFRDTTTKDILAGGMSNPMTTAGDIIYAGTGGAPTRLAGSVNDGYVLKYNTSTNTPYWSTDLQGGASGPWTDGAGITYLTDTAEDFAVGNTSLGAPFSIDVSANTMRVGSGTVANAKIDMYASDGDTGSIEYNSNDSWNFQGGNVGIGAQDAQSLLQVGSKTNRGDLEVYGDIIKKELINSKTVTGTINDVFVYDTTRDPDGGRWTEKEQSQGLSWYTETKDHAGESCVLASDDRCGDSAFPSKAVIVATNDAVYIFDANRNTMWMKFTQAGTYTLGADSNNNPSSVFALYGVIYVGTNGSSATGMYAIDFMNDRIYNYDSADRTLGSNNILNRNSATTYASGITAFAIGNNTSSVVNDVHGAILNGSSSILTNGGPGNGFTYLCAATEDGVSVVNLSGGFTLDYGDNLTDAFSACFITKRARLYAINKTLAQVERYGQTASGVVNIDTAYANQATPTDVWDEQSANYPHVVNSATKTAAPVINAYPDTLEVIERGSFAATGTEATTPYGDVIYVGHGGGLTEIHDVETPSTTSIGWSKEYTKDYETSYMSGNPRGNFVFNESSGLIYDKTIRNSTLAAPVAPTYGVNGVHGTAMRFNGTNQYLCSDTNSNTADCEVDTDYNVAAISFTVEAWFRHAASNPVSTNDVLIDRRYTAFAGSEGIGYTVEMNTSGQMVFGIQDTAATAAYDDSVTSTLGYADGQWHHLVAVNTDTALCLYVDGRLTGTCDTTLAATGTLDASQLLTIGADASAAGGGNFWDGDIDDVYFSGNGATTSDSLTQMQIRKRYLEGRSALQKRTIASTSANSGTSTSITKTSAGWVLNDYVGEIVEITGGTCSGQTRTVMGNTTDTLSVYPAWNSCTPDGTTTFEIQPEQLYGSTNSVNAVGIVDNTFLGENRKLYAGTNDGADGGGVSVFNGMGTSFVEKVYHSNSGIADDNATSWNGTDYDDMQSIGVNGSTVSMGSIANLWTEQEKNSLQTTADKVANNLNSIRAEMAADGLAGVSHEIGVNGGADLAEYYKSTEILEAGTVVATGDNGADTVKKTSGRYQKDVLGIVATAPGIILGTHEEDSYPIALAGRVPVNVTTENGLIAKGDQIASSNLAGYGMVAIETGRVIGTVLEDPDMSTFAMCPTETGLPAETKCGKVMVFVNLADFTGVTIQDLMTRQSYDASLLNPDFAKILSSISGEEIFSDEKNQIMKDEWTDIFKATSTLNFMRKINDPNNGVKLNSEILAKNVNSTGSVVSPLIVTDTLIAKNIKVESIEGLQFIQTGIQSAQNDAQEANKQTLNLSDEISNIKSQISLLASSQNTSVNDAVFKNIQAQKGIVVGDSAEFRGLAIFSSIVQFMDKVLFKKDVEFAGNVIFDKNTAGYAIIREEADKVKITFEKEYAQVPVVNVSLSLQQIEESELRKATEELLLVSDVKFIITDVSTKGFEIRISQKQNTDIPFSWHAIAVKDAQTFSNQDDIAANLNDKQMMSEITTDNSEIQDSLASEEADIFSVNEQSQGIGVAENGQSSQ